MAIDAAGNVVIASNSANRVQVIADHDGSYYGVSMTNGDIYTIAGDGTPGTPAQAVRPPVPRWTGRRA